MTKTEFIQHLAKKMDCDTAEAEKRLTAVLKSFQDVWQSEQELTLPGFGKLFTAHYPQRTARDPSRGRNITIGAKSVPRLKLSTALKLHAGRVERVVE